MSRINDQLWWKAAKGQAHKATWATAQRIESQQSDVFDRFLKLEALYDPNSPDADGAGENLAHVTENAIASNVDTVVAAIANTNIRARFMTDGGDWKQQRTARHLEWYAEEQVAQLEVLPKCRAAFKESAKKGNGLVKVDVWFGAPRVRQVLVENVIVDQNETRDGRKPRQFHEWDRVDADELLAAFPKYEEEIEKARNSRSGRKSGVSGRIITQQTNEVTVLWSYRLPIGKKGERDYVAGRETLTIEGADLIDRKWHKPFFPYAVMMWTERAKSWYGISGAERIAGIQRALNKRNWQIERVLDQSALLTTWVRPADANLTIKTSRAGNIGVIKGDYPQTPNPPLVSAETYQSRVDLRNSASEEFGQTRMATHGAKPGGLDSGVALREFRDQTTQRYAPQEKDFEQLVLDTVWLVLDRCKDLGGDAPVAVRHSRFGSRKLRWKDVDMGEAKVQIKAASDLSRTPAGRIQSVIEYAQAGIISQDDARRLLQHPDLESALSMYTAALEDVERCLDEIADGAVVMPEPFQNFEMCKVRGQAEYLKWRGDSAPEEVLESLRQFIVQAVWMQNGAAANTNMGQVPLADPTAAPPMDPGMPMGMAPPMPGTAPVAAFAPQAMQLRAG